MSFLEQPQFRCEPLSWWGVLIPCQHHHYHHLAIAEHISLKFALLRPILFADELNVQGTSHRKCKLSQQPVK